MNLLCFLLMIAVGLVNEKREISTPFLIKKLTSYLYVRHIMIDTKF